MALPFGMRRGVVKGKPVLKKPVAGVKPSRRPVGSITKQLQRVIVGHFLNTASKSSRALVQSKRLTGAPLKKKAAFPRKTPNGRR